MNAPEPHELFNLPKDKNKIEFKEDTHIENAGTFTIYLEDHTAGNIIKMNLLTNPNVLFAGYRMPHPLENKIELKVQTNSTTKPTTAFAEALDSLGKELEAMETEFDVLY